MSRSFADRIAAAEAALNAHLDAREEHVIKHKNWRKRLVEAQDFIGDAEEARTQQALTALMDDRIRHLQRDAQSAQRDLARLKQDGAHAARDPGGHSTLLRIVGKWENAAPARAKTSGDRVAESNIRLGLVNIEQTRTGPSRRFWFKWGFRGAALAGLMAVFLAFGDGGGAGGALGGLSGTAADGSAGSGGAVAALEGLITRVTGLPPLTQMVPDALAQLSFD